MKILILTNTWPSKSEVFIKNLVYGMIERGHHITVLCKKAKGERAGKELPNNSSVLYFLPQNIFLTVLRLIILMPLFMIRRSKAFISLCSALAVHHDFSTLLVPLVWYSVRKEKFDAIHCQFGYLGNMGLILKQTGLIQGPVISSFRGSDISSYLLRKPAVYRLLKKEGDLFLPVCTDFRDRLIALDFPPEKIAVYHSAINLSDFPFTSASNITSEIRTLFCAGRLVEKKGFGYAIDALTVILQRNPLYRLVIAGSGPLDTELRQRVERENLTDKVLFTGWIDQESMADMLKSSYAFLATNVESQTGDIDGIPNILKEAMAIGVPVIAFDHPGIAELITHRKNGIIVPAKNVQQLAAAIEELNDDILREQICASARKTIEDEYSKESQAQYLEQMIQERAN